MGRRIDFLKEINESLSLIMDGTRQLVELTPKIKDKDLKTIIASAGKDYAKLNYTFSLLLLSISPDIFKKDKIDSDFDSIIKPLKKEFEGLE